MGTFLGHASEGVFFIALSIWWMMNGYTKYIFALCSGRQAMSRVSFPLPGKRKIPLETFLKIAFPAIGLIADSLMEGPALLTDDGHFRKLSEMQHMSIHAMFILHSITDVFAHYNLPLIRGIEYLTAAGAFFWTGITFYFHAHMPDKEPLEEIVHILPLPLLFTAGVAMLMEMLWRRGVTTTVVRAYMLLTFGTWLSHIAFMLYSPFTNLESESSSYDRSDPDNVAFAVAAFGMHLCINLVFMVMCYVITYYVIRRVYGIGFTDNDNIDPDQIISNENMKLLNTDISDTTF